jgi:hypothetical protein
VPLFMVGGIKVAEVASAITSTVLGIVLLYH